jgi:pimeloyl-ACP methyl ester carboxylesterase
VTLDEATAESHAAHILRELDDADVGRDVVIAGYDIGSRIAQAALHLAPQRFAGAVLTPAYPGIGDRSADPSLAPVFWYQHFHRAPIASHLIDGDEAAVRRYLGYIWTSWRGSDAADTHPHFEEIVASYSRPGAFAASIRWYQANRGYAADTPPIVTPTIMLWPTEDPLFPLAWADRLDDHFLDGELRQLHGCGHFVPVEQPEHMTRAINDLLMRTDR